MRANISVTAILPVTLKQVTILSKTASIQNNMPAMSLGTPNVAVTVRMRIIVPLGIPGAPAVSVSVIAKIISIASKSTPTPYIFRNMTVKSDI